MGATTLSSDGPLNLEAGLHRRGADPSAPPILYGNDKEIENTKYLTPCYPNMPVEELRKRYWDDGVLWVKGLLEADMVNDFRETYLEMVNDGTGMLKPGTKTRDGIFSGADWRDFILPGAVRLATGVPDEGKFVENSNKAHNCEEYAAFKSTIGNKMEPFVQKLTGFEESYCLPRSILRCAVPGGVTTPVHYDQIFLRHGPPTSVTAWVPIGDIEVEGGGLIYLDRAHDIGVKYEEEFSKMNSGLSDEERMSAFNKNMSVGGWIDKNASYFGEKWSRCWMVGNYEAGDVVFHTPFTIHAGAKNQSLENRIRVSTDLRFVDRRRPFDQRWLIKAYSGDDPNIPRKIQPASEG